MAHVFCQLSVETALLAPVLGSCALSQLLPLASQVCLVVAIEEKADDTEGVQEAHRVKPVREGALSEEIVGGVGSSGHKLTLGERKHERK